MYKCSLTKVRRGFTLIEILLVMAVLGILSAITIFAINPQKQLADSRDATREADVFTIMQAVYQYASDNGGAFPSTITAVHNEICSTGAESCEGLADLAVLSDDEVYLISIPRDPLCESAESTCAENGTGYFIRETTSGRLEIVASSSENRIISITQ